ncbi:hypothetical protein QRZ34_28620 [Klebsiella michiganensis]|jgi:secreted effector protein SseD|uniref:hypothetical protein n=1 Tax=Klebsiella michiganensis TaxID=1134687 RepID=UPI002570BD37|nr:hypothetical protein [Klebsiella michiganensis]MDL4454957.1 hypothetical protein [Klebsiella michiganensis]
MNTINHGVNHTEKVPGNNGEAQDGLPSQAMGMYATMDNLILMLQKMNTEMRDLQRDFYASQQGAAFAKEMRAYDSKKEAIELNYKAAIGNAGAKIASGVLGVAGALGGAKLGAARGGEFLSSGLGASGKVLEGGVSAGMAGKSREAQLTQALGEYQANDAKEYYKSLEAVRDKATEASRRMLELTRELMSMQERIMSAVRI